MCSDGAGPNIFEPPDEAEYASGLEGHFEEVVVLLCMARPHRLTPPIFNQGGVYAQEITVHFSLVAAQRSVHCGTQVK